MKAFAETLMIFAGSLVGVGLVSMILDAKPDMMSVAIGLLLFIIYKQYEAEDEKD